MAAKPQPPAADQIEGKEENAPPPFGTEVPINAGGPLPRIITGQGKVPAGNYRAPAGCSRFKIRARAFPDLGHHYVLAKESDQASAEECFLKATGLAAEHRKAVELATKAKQEPPAPPELVTVELPD
jgi:hypothetical protein